MDLQSNNQPWKVKGVSKNTRLMARVGLYLLSFMTLFWLIFSIYLIIAPSPTTGDFWNDIFPYICNTVIIGGLILINIKLVRLSLAPISFTPSYVQVEPQKFGELFEVWYQSSLGIYSFKGPLVFGPDGIKMPENLQFPNSDLVTLPYSRITGLTVKGRSISFKGSVQQYSTGGWLSYITMTLFELIERVSQRRKVEFYVSETDGERMYRELKMHFPSVVQEVFL